MNTFLRRSFNEYTRQTDLKKSFARHNEEIQRIFEKSNRAEQSFEAGRPTRPEELYLLLLAPLVEVAWADGRVTSRESDAVLQAAGAYGLTAHEDLYCALMDTMISRPSPKMTARAWHHLHRLLVELPAAEFEMIGAALQVQARYVAEQSSNNLIGFLRGDGLGRDEQAVLQRIAHELKRAATARPQTIEFFDETPEDGLDRLLPLVPLVKVAWSEGRVTESEREVILAAARRGGIAPESASHRRLLDWLERHPTDDFYNQSLERLSRSWARLEEAERALRRLDVLSDCALVAEASAGGRASAATGTHVCEEELAAMKRIAQKLNDKHSMALS